MREDTVVQYSGSGHHYIERSNETGHYKIMMRDLTTVTTPGKEGLMWAVVMRKRKVKPPTELSQ